MKERLYKESVSDELWEILTRLMQIGMLSPFRLVGGTALSLQLGHRLSVDIDLFTDADYNSIDFNQIDNELSRQFSFFETSEQGNDSFGKTYYIGENKEQVIKLDMFYTDRFIRPFIEKEQVRMATIEEIAAMKIEVIGNMGRKKDFWDLHELLEYYSLHQLFDCYIERYPYSYSKEEIKRKLLDFQYADIDFDPICLKGKYWELIKEDIAEAVQSF